MDEAEERKPTATLSTPIIAYIIMIMILIAIIGRSCHDYVGGSLRQDDDDKEPSTQKKSSSQFVATTPFLPNFAPVRKSKSSQRWYHYRWDQDVRMDELKHAAMTRHTRNGKDLSKPTNNFN